MRKDFTLKISAIGDNRTKLLNELIADSIECDKITDRNEELSFYTNYSFKNRIIELARKDRCELIIDDSEDKRKSTLKRILSHSGLIVGLVLAMMLSYFFSGLILRIKIDNGNEQIRADILSVLDENGVHIGSFKNDFDYIKLERELKGKVSGISWAGISVQGSTLVIDTIDNIPIPESDRKRMPCNVIALYDCVVEKAEVFCGELKVSIGSGVRAGDVLISGERKKLVKVGKDDKETEITQYLRADGNIYGTFEKSAEFYFPYQETINTPTGNVRKAKYLNIFDTDIPLFLDKTEGNYTYKATKNDLEILGIELPLAVTDVEYSEYVEAVNTYTDEEIEAKIDKSLDNYKKSFLSDLEIKDISKDILKTDEGVKVVFKFTLYGVIGKQADIYLNK